MRRNRVLRAGILAGLFAVGMTSAGCSTMNNTEKGAAIGGAFGTAAGLGIGAATGNPRTGAIIGGLAGAGTGALVGNGVDKQEQRDRDVQQATAAAVAQTQAQQQKLGVFDVIKLSRDGLHEQLIINQIRTTGSTFQLTTSDLEALQKEGVSTQVIAEMQTARAVSPLATRVVVPPQPTTTTHVIYQEPIYRPVVYRPVVVAPPPPRPVIVAGGYYRIH